jgi:hypothetical protein
LAIDGEDSTSTDSKLVSSPFSPSDMFSRYQPWPRGCEPRFCVEGHIGAMASRGEDCRREEIQAVAANLLREQKQEDKKST